MREPIDPQLAVDYLIEHSRTFAQAKAERVHLEHFRKSKKALLMNECQEKAVAAREQYAYSHPDYIVLLEGLRVEVWRSENANNRTQDRTMR